MRDPLERLLLTCGTKNNENISHTLISTPSKPFLTRFDFLNETNRFNMYKYVLDLLKSRKNSTIGVPFYLCMNEKICHSGSPYLDIDLRGYAEKKEEDLKEFLLEPALELAKILLEFIKEKYIYQVLEEDRQNLSIYVSCSNKWSFEKGAWKCGLHLHMNFICMKEEWERMTEDVKSFLSNSNWLEKYWKFLFESKNSKEDVLDQFECPMNCRLLGNFKDKLDMDYYYEPWFVLKKQELDSPHFYDLNTFDLDDFKRFTIIRRRYYPRLNMKRKFTGLNLSIQKKFKKQKVQSNKVSHGHVLDYLQKLIRDYFWNKKFVARNYKIVVDEKNQKWYFYIHPDQKKINQGGSSTWADTISNTCITNVKNGKAKPHNGAGVYAVLYLNFSLQEVALFPSCFCKHKNHCDNKETRKMQYHYNSLQKGNFDEIREKVLECMKKDKNN